MSSFLHLLFLLYNKTDKGEHITIHNVKIYKTVETMLIFNKIVLFQVIFFFIK